MGMGSELAFIGSGFALVLGVLALLWMISAFIGRLVQWTDKAQAVTPKGAAPVPSPSPLPSSLAAPQGVVPAGHLAAIAAAVAVMTDGRGRVVSVSAPAHRASVWAQEGRMEHFSSHRVRSDWALPGPPHVEHDSVERMP